MPRLASTDQQKEDLAYIVSATSPLDIVRRTVDSVREDAAVGSRVPTAATPEDLAALSDGPTPPTHPARGHAPNADELAVAREIAAHINGHHFGDVSCSELAHGLRSVLTGKQCDSIFDHEKWSQFVAYRARRAGEPMIHSMLEYFIESCHSAGANRCCTCASPRAAEYARTYMLART